MKQTIQWKSCSKHPIISDHNMVVRQNKAHTMELINRQKSSFSLFRCRFVAAVNRHLNARPGVQPPRDDARTVGVPNQRHFAPSSWIVV